MKMKLGSLGAIFLVAAIATTAASETYKIDNARSKIGFRIGHLVGTVNGKFTQFDGTIEIDRARPEQSSVTVTIQVNSIDTGIVKRDNHLRSSEFFDAAKYPVITFKSGAVKQTGPQSGDIVGNLTMHGVTKPITLQVKLLTPLKEGASMSQSRWEVTCDRIKRRDFGLLFPASVEGISMIGGEVTPKIDIVAVPE